MQKKIAIIGVVKGRAGVLAGCAGILAACVLSGCTVGPKYHPPSIPPPAAKYKEAPPSTSNTAQDNGVWKVAQPSDAKIRGDWWAIFNEPELNALEDQLNINNQTIKEYFEDYMEARALVGEERAQYYPTASAAPSYTRSRSSGNLTNSSTANPGTQSSLYELPATISWEPDLWGRVRNAVHAAEYSAQVSAADLENERLTEQASLAEYYFEIRGQDALIKLYTDTVAADKKSLDLTQAEYDTGTADYISVVEAQSTLEGVQSSLTNLRIARAQYEHAIAMLIGKQPSTFSISPRPLTSAAPPIPLGLPSELVERRPDVAAAERTMASENAEIGVAYSAFFPALTLSATGGYESSPFTHLLDWPSRFWSIGPSISQPLFNAALSPTLHQYISTYNADVASYRQTVLTAFQQVEDYLAATRYTSIQIQQQRRAVDSSQRALNMEMGRYQTGLDPYIDVITLQTTLLTNQQTLASLQITHMTSAVELVEALGGGWDKSQLPTPKQTAGKPPKAETKIQQ